MANKCFSLLRGEVLRATRLDRCGRLVDTACSAIVTDGFISVAFTSNITEGETITVTKANGKQCVNDTPPSEFDSVGATITFCNVDPELYAMLTGQPVEYDANGDAVGFRMRKGVSLAGSGVALELWSNVPGEVCEGGEGSWGYLVLPFVQGGVLGDFTLENNAVTFTIQGMVTKSGNEWGRGPYDVVPDESGLAAPLNEPLTTDDHFLVRWTNIAPPEPGCTCLASGPAPTTATAGTPGTYDPAGAYAPNDLEDLTTLGVTASPTTAWTTGQYIVLGDDSHAHWDGTAWVAGDAA